MPLIRRSGGTTSSEGKGQGEGAAGDGLRSRASDERWAAARALSGRPEAVDALGAALAVEPDPRVREAILTSLARIGTAQSAAVITPLIRSDDASTRTGAIDALRVMPAALSTHLAVLLNDADADVRILACDLARQLPGPTATEMLGALLDREAEANVCAAAIDVLAECGGPEALAALGRCAERFADVPFVVFSARIASDRISSEAPPRGD